MKKHDRIPDDDPIDRALREGLDGALPPDVLRTSERHFDAFRRQLAERDSSSSGRRARAPRLAWAGAGALATFALAMLMLLISAEQDLTWAQVVEQFKAVEMFSATVYMTEDPLEPPERVEIWVGRDKRLRVHHAGRVFFARGDKVGAVFDARTRQRLEFEDLDRRELRKLGFDRPLDMIHMMGSMEALSLDGLLALFCGKKTISEPIPNAHAGVAEALTVFDVTGDRSPEWMRIWVLPGSNLPLRLRSWDPRDGDCVEVLFDYTQTQPDEAFDAETFEKELKGQSGRANRLYGLLKDPGGQMMTPGDLFEASGYHMPEIVATGRTEDGLFWVKSRDAANRLPDGRHFYGFGMLTDDLGQEYMHNWLGHQLKNDLVIEYFVPLEFGAGFELPATYTLTCWAQPDHREQPDDVVGSVKVTEWEEGTPVPILWKDGVPPDARSALRKVIVEWRVRADWDRFDALLETIPGEPEDDPMALFREKQRLYKGTAMRRAHPDAGWDEQVNRLAARLYNIIKDDFLQDRWTNERVITEHARTLLEAGERDAARAILSRHAGEVRESGFEQDWLLIGRMAGYLVQHKVAAFEELDDLFGYDLTDDEKTLKQVRMSLGSSGGVSGTDNPAFDPWRDYVKKVGKHYTNRPLPAAYERVEGIAPLEEGRPSYRVPLPGHEGYSVFLLGRGGWSDLLYGLARPHEYEFDMVRLTEELRGEKLNSTWVTRDDIEYADIIHALAEERGLTWVDVPEKRKVWVARYDGRPLPYWRDVCPLEAPHLEERPFSRGGGTSTTVATLLELMEQAVNGHHMLIPDPDDLLIVDETGLPTRPGPNQTGGSICLSYSYAFWTGDEGVDLAKEWFEETFGITFHEEERELVYHELRAGTGHRD